LAATVVVPANAVTRPRALPDHLENRAHTSRSRGDRGPQLPTIVYGDLVADLELHRILLSCSVRHCVGLPRSSRGQARIEVECADGMPHPCLLGVQICMIVTIRTVLERKLGIPATSSSASSIVANCSASRPRTDDSTNRTVHERAPQF